MEEVTEKQVPHCGRLIPVASNGSLISGVLCQREKEHDGPHAHSVETNDTVVQIVANDRKAAEQLRLLEADGG